MPRVDKESKREYMRGYYKRNRATLDKQSRDWGYQQRARVIDLLGGCCKRCGINDPDVLAVDHINDNGAEERRVIKSQRSMQARLLLSGGVGYQLLCHNCNWKKRLEVIRRAQSLRISA